MNQSIIHQTGVNFLILPQYFQKSSIADASKCICKGGKGKYIHTFLPCTFDRLSGVVVERPPQAWDIAGSIPSKVIQKTLINDRNGFPTLTLMIAEQALGLAHWCEDKSTSSTGNFPTTCCDITEILLTAV